MQRHMVNQTKIPAHGLIITIEANPLHVALYKSDYLSRDK